MSRAPSPAQRGERLVARWREPREQSRVKAAKARQGRQAVYACGLPGRPEEPDAVPAANLPPRPGLSWLLSLCGAATPPLTERATRFRACGPAQAAAWAIRLFGCPLMAGTAETCWLSPKTPPGLLTSQADALSLFVLLSALPAELFPDSSMVERAAVNR